MPIIGPGAAFQGAARLLGVRFDPYGTSNFHVEIQGLVAGGFTDVSGLSVRTEVETIREGGVNTFEYKLPGTTSYTDLTLRRGISDFDLLWSWYQDVVEGKIRRKNMTIFLLDHQGLPAMWWDVYGAYPIQFEGPTFDASSNTVGFQTIVLTHQGLTRPLSGQILAATRGVAANIGF